MREKIGRVVVSRLLKQMMGLEDVETEHQVDTG